MNFLRVKLTKKVVLSRLYLLLLMQILLYRLRAYILSSFTKLNAYTFCPILLSVRLQVWNVWYIYQQISIHKKGEKVPGILWFDYFKNYSTIRKQHIKNINYNLKWRVYFFFEIQKYFASLDYNNAWFIINFLRINWTF